MTGNRSSRETESRLTVDTAKNVVEGVAGEIKEAAGKVLNNEELAREGHDERVAADDRHEREKEAANAHRNARTEGGDTLPLPDFTEKTTLGLDEATYSDGNQSRS